MNIRYKAWDDSLVPPGINTVTIARYLYDNAGHLRTQWDPRIGTVGKTRYSYDSNGELVTITPPGLATWTLSYATIPGDANPGRLTQVSRPGDPTGTQIQTVAYSVPLSGTGAPYDLGANETRRWAQTGLPVTGTAIFPADEVPTSSPPSDYDFATIYYTDAIGRVVNIASPSPAACATATSQCNTTTTQYDDFGHAVRQLAPRNRGSALGSSTSDSAAQEAVLSQQLQSYNTYSTDGQQLLDEYGPAEAVSKPAPNADTIVQARTHAHYSYDQGAPSGVCPCNLVTTKTLAASPIDGSADFGTTTEEYAYSIGSDTSGWTLHRALETIQDPGGLDLTTTNLYDTGSGAPTERRLPANPSGGDAHAMLTIYYTAGTNSHDSACGNKPEYADLLCRRKPAAQPSGSLPPVPITTQVSYNMWDEPLVVTEASAGTTVRTTGYTYDAAARLTTTAITGTVGTAISSVTQSFDSSTQLPTTSVQGSKTITRSYDSLGRLSTYEDSSGNTSVYGYDLNDRVISVDDGKSTRAISYHDAGENGPFATSIVDADAGTFSATWDAGGDLHTLTYPNSLVATITRDATGTPGQIQYALSGVLLWSQSAIFNSQRQVSSFNSTDGSQTYEYDDAGRLLGVSDTAAGGSCVVRSYSFDSDTNRSALGTTPPAPDGSCGSSGTVTVSSSYDEADRAVTSGYSYDALGRATALPTQDSPSGQSQTIGYFVNDMVASTSTAGSVDTFTPDTQGRVDQWTQSSDSTTHTNHYSDDGGAPTWTAENSAASLWTRNIQGFAGLMAVESGSTTGNTIDLQIQDLRGNIVATMPSTSGTLSSSRLTTDEYGVRLASAGRFAFGGTMSHATDSASGLVIMGARIYDPAAGRFLQADPVAGGSANDYEYAAGDPVNRADPSGAALVWRFYQGWKLQPGSGFGGPTCTPLIHDCSQYVGEFREWQIIQVSIYDPKIHWTTHWQVMRFGYKQQFHFWCCRIEVPVWPFGTVTKNVPIYDYHQDLFYRYEYKTYVSIPGGWRLVSTSWIVYVYILAAGCPYC